MVEVTRICEDIITPLKCTQMAALLDVEPPAVGETLPPLWHWIFANDAVPQSRLGHDGHARADDSPIDLHARHRMWAAGEVMFLRPLQIGDAIRRTSRLLDTTIKTGRSGDMIFVRHEHVIEAKGVVALHEVQTLVYRHPAPPAVVPLEERAREVDADALVINDLVMFRYSGLTFNSHRIHLDRHYCAGTYGDPRLVVHAPLLATLLADAATRGGPLRSFAFRALAPTRESEPFRARLSPDGTMGELVGLDGVVRMVAQIDRSGC